MEELLAKLEVLYTEANRSRAFIRGAETQLTKTLALADELEGMLRQYEPPAATGPASFSFSVGGGIDSATESDT